MSAKERIIVVCPGRGSYAAGELGYLAKHHSEQRGRIDALDAVRAREGAEAVAVLDALPKFSPSKHLPGGNASNLIYTSALLDFAAIDRERFDVVAVCGNSLGWYLSLACAGALSLEDGAHLVSTMGHLMEREGVGGQLLYPVASEDWTLDPVRRAEVLEMVEATPNAFLSIDLGGSLVLAGDEAAIEHLRKSLAPVDGNAPPILPRHAAFHTHLLDYIAEKAQAVLPATLFQAPRIPMIDGTGKIWTPDASDLGALHLYTLGAQITQTYDFAKSLEVALKEFAPDRLVLLGPGSSLGAPVAQSMIVHRWRALSSREEFAASQLEDPFLIAMGRQGQREIVV
ncbi:MAG: ACP S-malonyltransferase [Pseudomonadota bacterium]